MSNRQTHGSIVMVPKALLTVVLTVAGLLVVTSSVSAAQAVTFDDAKRQTHEFIEYYDSIQLSAAQEAVKKEALTALPAPCCSDNTASTVHARAHELHPPAIIKLSLGTFPSPSPPRVPHRTDSWRYRVI